MRFLKTRVIFSLGGLLLMLSSCRSVNEIAIGRISDMMASPGGSQTFTRDNDPRFVADALPFALKMYEMLIDLNPEDAPLRLAAGKSFVMYANAFLQTPALMLPDESWEDEEILLRRAGKMYIRGRDYILSGLALRVKDSPAQMVSDPDGLLARCSAEDAAYLYWAAAGWMGAFSCDPFDLELGSDVYIPVTFLYRALELDDSLERGGVHDLLISLWSTLPRGNFEKAFKKTPVSAGAFAEKYYRELGVSQDEESRARHHLDRALEISEGQNPSPYISFALGFPVMDQNYEEFEELLNKALAVDALADPDNELTTLVMQEKAAWYLEHREDYFLLDF